MLQLPTRRGKPRSSTHTGALGYVDNAELFDTWFAVVDGWFAGDWWTENVTLLAAEWRVQ
jgi:hypothetical protein